MLRITAVQNEGAPTVLKIEGKLLEPWIGELHEACRKTFGLSVPATLDVAGLSFVDAPGTIALRDLLRRGATLRGCSPLIAELLKEIDR